ncbi:hypothetical protein HMN09_00414900 [Mycena chlorophos]|uniref:Uncharacterized protein n=1 Tax=Mycena chlorophos TaxID=658473 RepID=A0A8H6WJ51_MYCCL|nr:hypothetical protein HMN09_00414900 [Mycena chlorophos]
MSERKQAGHTWMNSFLNASIPFASLPSAPSQSARASLLKARMFKYDLGALTGRQKRVNSSRSGMVATSSRLSSPLPPQIVQPEVHYLRLRLPCVPMHRTVKSALSDTSRILESLSATAGVESFVLAVDPTEDGTSDPGFLGGSVVGREYWRGMRGGGEPGARAFKSHCVKAFQASVPSTSTSNARTIKSTLYDAVRTALRTASGVRNAEMKWTNPALLNIYGVALVGWPPSIPAQNPSSLKADQNKQLLEALENGTMYFTRILAMPQQSSDPSPAPTPPAAPPPEDESSFAWAIQYEPDPLSTSGEDEGAAGDRPAKRARPG